MYCPLFIKTDYSLLSSLIKVDDLILALKRYNISSFAFCDNNLFGVMEIVNKCKKNDIKAIIGLEIKFNNNRILLYAKSDVGYHNLCHIETIKNDTSLNVDILSKYSKDIICIAFMDNDGRKILNEIYSDFYIGVNNKELESNVLNLGYQPVFINETLYLYDYLYKYLPYVFMIRDGKNISDGIDFVYQHNHLLTNEEASSMVSNIALNNSLLISDMCCVSFSKEVFMPKYDVPDSKEYLKSLSIKGLTKRLNGNVTDPYKKRLMYELDVICNMHFEDYFLVVYDYIKYAKKNGILVGPGRGSAAGSLVSYSLGITDVDPLKYDLLFERFLNPERVTMPDIDTDFPDVDRDRVISYVRDRYGVNNVAGIITFGTLASKQAIRDVGRVLNVRSSDIDFICKNIGFKDTLKDLKKNKEVFRFISSDEKLKTLYNIACIIENNKRHTSVHAAGIVISYKNLSDILPVIKNDDMYLTEYTMDHLEEIGLIKMDFLGIKNLTIIKNVLDDIKFYENKNIDINSLDFNDKNVIKLFYNGDTTGVFQFESDGMKKFLKDLKPVNFSDICSAIAFFRPGPASNIPSFIRRREGKEKIDYIDDRLKDILFSTSGIIVYQEQIMQIANRMANYTFGEADILRRAMSKKKLEVLKNEKEKFINQSVNNGYSLDIATRVYDLILSFANYGFNKSHSVSYSIVAYRMAYLKCYYPKYFYSNLLNNVVGSDVKTLEYLREVKKLDIKVVGPTVNMSLDKKYLVDGKRIIFPLSSIRNVGGVISNYIASEREKGTFKDIYDFLIRTVKKTNNKKVLESLIYSKALSCFGYNVNTLINNIDNLTNYVDLVMDLGDVDIVKPNIVFYDEFDNDFLLEKEKELFGFYLTSHKSEKYKLLNSNICDVSSIKDKLNRVVDVIVNVDKIKEIGTKNNRLMAFIAGSDNTGEVSCTLFPDVYDKYNNVNKGNIVKITGKVEKRYDEYQIIVSKIDILN